MNFYIDCDDKHNFSYQNYDPQINSCTQPKHIFPQKIAHVRNDERIQKYLTKVVSLMLEEAKPIHSDVNITK